MKLVKDFPPNAVYIRQFFPIDSPEFRPIFAYGDTIYAPHNDELPEDYVFHESIHTKQQQGDPEHWWVRYCTEKLFRLEAELEAYAAQWLWVRKNVNIKAGEFALEYFAGTLSSKLYNLGLSHNEAKIKIKNKAKSINL